MCQPAVCPSCGKATYVGCGQHVEEVLAGVPQSERCGCDASNDASTTQGWPPFWRS